MTNRTGKTGDLLAHTDLHHAAASCENPDVIATLMDWGADITALDEEGSTPLHFAAINSVPHVVDTLLDRGADIAARNYHDEMTLHCTARQANQTK